MAGAATAAAVVLAAVLAWAALAKLIGRPATVAAFAALGLPAPRALGTAVPMAELATGALLVARPEWGGIAALILLTLFTGVVVGALARGTTAGCGCFGGSAAAPISPSDVLRNGMLAALALVATGAARPARPGPAASAAVLAAAAAGVALLRATRHRTR